MVAGGIGETHFEVKGISMWWWRKVRRAAIPSELRDRFELFGEDVFAHALAVGVQTGTQGVELIGLLQAKRSEIMAWLQERRDIAERREQRLETSEWAILIFVVCGVAVDLMLLAHGA